MVQRYIPRPPEYEAIQYTGNITELMNFLGPRWSIVRTGATTASSAPTVYARINSDNRMVRNSINGNLTIFNNCWVVKPAQSARATDFSIMHDDEFQERFMPQ